ncbi:MAG: glycosyltransferase family 2 protein [Hyphomicrobiales bacterium]|nr:glycosyltransferase family 2 protein [Hyphomicrobiales bacterium]
MALPELAVVIPSFNEADNIEPMVERLERVLDGIAWEAVYVDDDSTDGTRDRLHAVARRDPRVRYIHRIGRRGLSSAVVEGILSTSAPYVAVIDADLQHDEGKLPAMLDALKQADTDIVVGSRYTAGGGVGEWDRKRVLISRVAGMLSRAVVKVDLSDPMSGFFMVRRASFERCVRRLSEQGYKILLDIFASAPEPLAFKEVAYEFRTRQHGESKLDAMVTLEYLLLIMDKLIGHVVPVRFLMFGLVGGSGVVVHFLVLWLAHRVAGLDFALSQTLATFVAMTSNFFLNNTLTYRDRRLKGWAQVRGLVTFYFVCGLGVVANVGVANFVFERDYLWWVAGGAGAIVGAVWNYAASSVFTWGKK